jgi:long-subunit acyl-CoA synthetase (AMP-forming)
MVDRERAVVPKQSVAPDTPARLFRARCEEWAELPALRWKERGIWCTASWGRYYAHARAVALALINLGLHRGDVVAILSENRPEWAYVEFGALAIGCTVAAFHPYATATEIARTLAKNSARILFVENVVQLDKVHGIDEVGIVLFDGRRLHDDDRSWVTVFADLVADTVSDAQAAAFDRAIDEGSTDDPALFVDADGHTGVTSGTISNRDLMAQIHALSVAADLPPQIRNLAFFSFSHIGARIAALHLQLMRSTIVHFPERPDTVLNDIVEVQPHLLYAPARFWEKLYARVELTMRAAIRPARMLYRQACRGGTLSAWLVYPRLRASLGMSRLRLGVSDGILAPGLVHWLGLLGVTPVDAKSWFGAGNGGAGSAIPDCPIEAMLRVSPLIADALLFGSDAVRTCAILIDRDGATAIAQDRQIAFSDISELIAAPAFLELIRAEIDRVNGDMSETARIAAFRVLADIAVGEERATTLALRINRRLFVRHYASLIEEMSKEVNQ